MAVDLNTLPLPAHVRFKLHSNGFTSTDDLKDLRPLRLADEAQLTPEEALDVLDLIALENDEHNTSAHSLFVTSALDVFLEENSKPPIMTFCKRLDQILGGGIPVRKVTEICGCPGSGKTQICLQLSVNAQVPPNCGGLGGKSIFIDTEGSFFVERLAEIASGTVEHCKKIINNLSRGTTEEFDLKTVLENVHYYRCQNFIELIAVINVLPEFLKDHPKVCFIAIDSISFHFRYGFEKLYDRRARLLSGLSQSLVKIATEFGVAVVLTNQMTTRISYDGEATLVPALGESWGHACATRLILSFDDNKRKAHLFKCPWKEEGIALYQITALGIRDIGSFEMQEQKNIQLPSHERNFISDAQQCQFSHTPCSVTSDYLLSNSSISSRQSLLPQSGSTKLDCHPSTSSCQQAPSSHQSSIKFDRQSSSSFKQSLSYCSLPRADSKSLTTSYKQLAPSHQSLIKMDPSSLPSFKKIQLFDNSTRLVTDPPPNTLKSAISSKEPPSCDNSINLDCQVKTSLHLQPYKKPRHQ